jgi:hypothetical protein
MNLNAKVHPALATAVLVLAAIAIAVKIWGDGRSLDVGGPAQMLRAPAGHVYIQAGNRLLQHYSDGRFAREVDLASLDVTRVIGGIAFFPNGDLLIRRGSDPRSLMDNLRAYGRLKNRRPIFDAEPGSGLARCDLQQLQCVPFGTPPMDFRSTFHAYVEQQGDTVWFSDTPRHTLRRFSAAGEQLASLETGVRFPNQLLVDDGRLLVADTNNHRLAAFDISGPGIPANVSGIDVIPDEAAKRDERWPTHFARVGERWWVNNMRSNMRNGGIYVFDQDWRFIRRLALPEDADPITILPFGPGALVSDWDNLRVYRLDADGRRLDDFESAGLVAALGDAREQRRFYAVVSWLGIGLFVLVLAGLLLKGALEPAVKKPAQPGTPAKGTTDPPDDWVWFRPVPRLVRKTERSARVALAAMSLLMAAFVVLAIVQAQWLILFGLALPLGGLAAITAAVYWMTRAMMNTAIGLRGNQIALRDHRGRESRSSLHHVVFNDSAIATRDQAVFLGQPRKSIYDRAQLEGRLIPHLGNATRISDWQMQKTLLRVRHPGAVLLSTVLLASLLLGGMVLLLKFASCGY